MTTVEENSVNAYFFVHTENSIINMAKLRLPNIFKPVDQRNVEINERFFGDVPK